MSYQDEACYSDFGDAKRAAASRARKYYVPVSVKHGFQMTGTFIIVDTCFGEGGCKTEHIGEKVPAWFVSWIPPEYVDRNDLLSTGLLEVQPDGLSIAERQEKFERQREADRQVAERQREAKRRQAEQDRITIQNQWDKARPAGWDDWVYPPNHPCFDKKRVSEILEDTEEYSENKEREEYDGWFYSDEDA